MDLRKAIYEAGNLTAAEKRIADLILQNPEEIVRMTGKEAESRLYVSKSALYRFCRKLGLDGFNELKFELAKMRAESRKRTSDRVDVNLPFSASDTPMAIADRLNTLYTQSMDGIRSTLDPDRLSKAVSILEQAGAIAIFTSWHNQFTSGLFRDKLLDIGRRAEIACSLETLKVMAMNVPEDHAALIISYSGNSRHLLGAVRELKARGIPMILISHDTAGEMGRMADVCLQVSGKEEVSERVGQFSSDLELLFLLDVLYGSLINTDRLRALSFMSDRLDDPILRRVNNIDPEEYEQEDWEPVFAEEAGS